MKKSENFYSMMTISKKAPFSKWKDLKWGSDAIRTLVLTHFWSISGERNYPQSTFKAVVHIRHETENSYCTHQPTILQWWG
jgi:hypothetical protein